MQRGRSFLWRYFPFYIIIILTSILAISWYTSVAMKNLYLNRIAVDLEARAHLLGQAAAPEGAILQPDSLQALCRRMGETLGNRFTLIKPSGEVMADSDEDITVMENHANRPEIRDALQRGRGLSTRYSQTLKHDLMYIAIRQSLHPESALVIRTSLPVMHLSETLNALFRRTALAALFIILGSTVISLLISREIRKPVETLKHGAQQFGQGRLGHRIYISDPEEFTLLGNAMNRMAGEISGRMATITEQKNELESVLSSMNEAVLVVDSNERLLRFNHAAAEYFLVESEQATGRPIQEVIRNFDLLKFVRHTLNSHQGGAQEIVLHDAAERFLQAHGTLLLDFQNRQIGVVVVLNDVTDLKRLENIRKEFVANVSHELKTPITAIKGSVETLRDGAAQDPKAGRRFMDIILKHADRLNTIVEDLLNLSRIEKSQDDADIEKETLLLKPLVDEALLLCRTQADDRQIVLETDIDDHFTLTVNGNMVQQALINLVDNAIKYAETGTVVQIEARRSGHRLRLSVTDAGPGIPAEHHARLFERFYRVDTSRSRELGGTGLGLSIVKHIMQAHHGRVDLESTVGQGSTFTLTFP